MMKRPEKLDLFMSCVFSLLSYSATRKFIACRLDSSEQAECVQYISFAIGKPEITLEEMVRYGLENYKLLKETIG